MQTLLSLGYSLPQRKQFSKYSEEESVHAGGCVEMMRMNILLEYFKDM